MKMVSAYVRLLRAGDAGGFINPLSGEGLYYTITSGELAAETITEALEKNSTTEEFLSKYQTVWQKDFGKDIDLILKVVKRGSMEYAERVFKIAFCNPILTDLMMGVITGQTSVKQNKWKMMRRFLYSSFKNRLHLYKKMEKAL
jgi:flavin-dependent dehydrogenase